VEEEWVMMDLKEFWSSWVWEGYEKSIDLFSIVRLT
jgi:hypothetical protein